MVRRMVPVLAMIAFVPASDTSAQPQSLTDTSKLEARVEALEKQVDLLHKQLASLEAELQRPPIYKALKLTNVRLAGGPYTVGDNVTITYALTNTSLDDLHIPVDRSGPRALYLVGARQHWIERDGNNKTIPGIPPRTARHGAKYAAGGGVIPTRPTIAAGDTLTLQQRLSTGDYPAGKYICFIEFKKVRGGVLQTETIEFELNEK